jgi:MYXO-CTERM domain-containing protein
MQAPDLGQPGPERRARMRAFVIGFLAVGLGYSGAFAGIVTFDPLTPTTVDSGERVSLAVGVSLEEMADFSTARVVLASMDLQMADWVYNPDWLAAMAFPVVEDPPGVFPNERLVGGNLLFTSEAWTVGTLEVGTDGLPFGDYTVFVDGDTDGISGLYDMGDTVIETLAGSAVVSVIPEPGALVLLGVGGLAVLRRRR